MKQEKGYLIYNPNQNAKLKLLCFHHAGGSALSMVPLVRNLSSEVEVCLFELPGRGMTNDLPFQATFCEAKEYLLKNVAPYIDRPSVLFGHSLGGLFVYALSSLLDDKSQYIKKLIISAARSPITVSNNATYPETPFTRRTRESVISDIRRLGGVPSELESDLSLFNSIVDVTGRDFHLLDTFRFDDKAFIKYPMELWLGEQDLAVPEEEVELWEKMTLNEYKCKYFKGGHFYLNENEDPAKELSRELMGIYANIKGGVIYAD
ncbi:thioesterase II family protein [Lysinibacillus sphaericus]|uniref:thioesterase II family protein n=1 Tax=Lysinibacillus sphaericus TaxID=1421 RepID=UPI003D04ED6E